MLLLSEISKSSEDYFIRQQGPQFQQNKQLYWRNNHLNFGWPANFSLGKLTLQALLKPHACCNTFFTILILPMHSPVSNLYTQTSKLLQTWIHHPVITMGGVALILYFSHTTISFIFIVMKWASNCCRNTLCPFRHNCPLLEQGTVHDQWHCYYDANDKKKESVNRF